MAGQGVDYAEARDEEELMDSKEEARRINQDFYNALPLHKKIGFRVRQFFAGHWVFGPITIYGDNAMHWAVRINSGVLGLGYICFNLPFFSQGKWHPLYFYLSPNATPGKATLWLWGKKGCGY